MSISFLSQELMRGMNMNTSKITANRLVNITTTVVPKVDHFDLVENLRNVGYNVVQRIIHVVNGV